MAFSVVVKASNDKRYTVEIDPSATIADLKQAIQRESEIEPSRMRLIYSGRVLSKDEDTIEAYKIKDGNTIHLVQSKAGGASSAGAGSGAGTTSTSNTTTGATTGNSSTGTTNNAAPQIPMAAGTGSGNPLTGLTGARYAGQIGLPSASMFGADGGMTGFPGGVDNLEEMLTQPGVREAMDAAFSNPQFIEMMMQSNPQLRNAPPYVRQMLQSEQFRRQMLDPNFLRQMQQMQSMFGGPPGGPQARAPFPAPGSTTTPTTGDANAQQTPGQDAAPRADGQNPFASMMNNPDFLSMLGGFGGAGGPGGPFGGDMLGGARESAPADTRPPEERYADQLRQLNDMGFYEFDRNIAALRRSGGR